jgi:AraC family transcriptional regulator of adaptative response / DNA-3-methyladenine glycosylase II
MASAAAEPTARPDGLLPDRCYRALVSRDPRFDCRFFVGVRTTGVYCRPICPARTPLRRNVSFFTCAAAAEEAGFRPCRRCRPETAPGTPAWVGSSTTVTRALRLIAAGGLDAEGVDGLAERLGVGARQVRRLFAEHLGASPLAVARTRRVHFARRLIDETELPMSQVALASGFASIRQFNHSIRSCFGRSPSSLRGGSRATPSRGGSEELTLRVAYRAPFDWGALLDFLALRAIPGVERVEAGVYERSILLGGEPTRLRISAPGDGAPLVVRLRAAGDAALLPVVDRVRHLFDLCADPHRIATDLGRDRVLARCIARLPGLRVPGAWDGYELAVRAILGQQVTVRGASTLAGRLVERFGVRLPGGRDGPTHLFPRPETLAEADVAAIGLPGARARSLRALSQAVASGELVLEPGAHAEETQERLQSLPGIGAWTAEVISMRALGEPDAFPVGDLGLRRALGRPGSPIDARSLAHRAERWRPWRAYAAMWLWCGSAR